MKTSSILIVAGVVLLIVPIPPFGVIGGALLIALGLTMKLFGDA